MQATLKKIDSNTRIKPLNHFFNNNFSYKRFLSYMKIFKDSSSRYYGKSNEGFNKPYEKHQDLSVEEINKKR